MKTVTGVSADGKRKMRVPVVAVNGAFCVAKGVYLQPGVRKVAPYWVVYHSRSGCSMGEGFRAKKDALKMLERIAKVPGNWDQDPDALRKDAKLTQDFSNAWMSGLCDLGIYKRIG